MNSDRSSKTKAKGQANGKNQSKSKKGAKAPKNREAPAARVPKQPRMLGLSDLLQHSMPFVQGYVYVGNGTLGVTDGVYAMDNAKTGIVFNDSSTPAARLCQVPVRFANATGGSTIPTYVTDIIKHFARYRLKKLSLEFVSLQPSTANSMTLTAAPVRGNGDSDQTVYAAGVEPSANLEDTIAQAGARSCASWESMKIDLTPFIAGGSGAKQNEFNTDKDDLGGPPYIPAPSAFVISGSNSSTALRGTRTHMIVVRPVIDLLDFIAGNTVDVTMPDQ